MANGDPRDYDAAAMGGNFGPAYGPPPPPTGWKAGAPKGSIPGSSPGTAPTVSTIPTTAPLPGLNVPTTGMSPQALQSQAEMGQEMQKAGMDNSPVRSWTQGMARVADALVGGSMSRDAYQQQAQLYNKGLSDSGRLAGGGGAGGGYVSEGPHQAQGGPDTQNMDPEWSGRLNQLMSDAAGAGIATHLVSGYRDYDTQAKLYANYQARLAGQQLPYPQMGNGELAARPGNSMHNFGRAGDVIANDPKQQPALIALARQPWRRIRAGADFGDNDHFEAVEGRTAPLVPYRQTIASQ
jgi:hypothetical protein